MDCMRGLCAGRSEVYFLVLIMINYIYFFSLLLVNNVTHQHPQYVDTDTLGCLYDDDMSASQVAQSHHINRAQSW